MNKRKTLKKTIFIFLGFSALLTILSVFVWKMLYLDPKGKQLLKEQEQIKEELLNKKYNSYEDLIIKLDNISDISYSIESEEHEIKESNTEIENSKVFFSELIEIEGRNYLLKIYSNNILYFSELVVGFFKVHAVVTIIVTLSIGFMIERKILNPLRKIIFDIKEYKFGKKPQKNNIKNEIDIIQNEFVELTDILDEERKEQNRIIASISHDLRTPLTSVIGYSNLIQSKNMTTEKIIKNNEKINIKSKNMKDILNNFDEYLADNTVQSLKLETIKIEDLIKQLYEDYRFDLQASNIDFIIESDCSLEFIKIDIRKIRRIFSNIISNSVRYIKASGIIKIKIEKEEKFYKFTISDTGKGVDESIVNKIFDPFFTTDNSRKISGLGLSICKEFVEIHGGTINAYNNLGLTIEFTIPIIPINSNN